ncbi:MAG: CBS domain-containing protein [Desulfococcaceae bacterium]
MEIVTSHKNTDFDALASVIAATLIYPKAVPVLPKNINSNVKAFLSIHKKVFSFMDSDEFDPETVTRLIVVDVNRWDRLVGMKKLKNKEHMEVILWDHHPDKGDISANQSCQEYMGANITLMVRQLKSEKIPLTPVQATLFLTGLYEDTGNLMFPSTKPEDAMTAAWLLENGADLNVLASWLRPVYGEKQKNILFEMLRSEKTKRVNGYNISFHKLDIEGHVGSLALVVHMCREILNADAVFGIFTGEKRGKAIIIGRSNADGLDIGAIMRSLGGGGHAGAGSATLSFVNPDTVEEMITELIEGNQHASVKVSDLMSFPVFTVSPDTPMKEAGMLLREKGCTGFPVTENGKIAGILSRRDFRKIKKKSGENAPVRAFMSPQVVKVEPNRSPMQAAQLMVRHDIGRLPVVDQDGTLIGIVTRSDVMLYLYDMLPD